MTEPALDEPGRDRIFDWTFALVIAVTAGAAVLLAVTPTRASNDLANYLQIIAPAVATWSAARAAHAARDRGWRMGWTLIGLSCASWGVGQVLWTWKESVEHHPLPFPSVADVFYLLALPLAVAGLLYLSSSDNATRRTRILLDGVIVATAMLFVSWITVLGPTFHASTTSRWAWMISVAYPAGDVVLVTMAVLACIRTEAVSRIAVGFAALGFATFAVADSVFAYTAVHSRTVSNVSNVAWVAGYLLIALGAFHATRVPPHRHPEREENESEPPSLVLLPYVPVAIVVGISGGYAMARSPITVGAVEFWIGVALITLLLIRQAFVIVENSRLTQRLAQSNTQLQYQLLHDGLTGLPNRPLFLDRLRVALHRLPRHEGAAAVMFIDLDGFKLANDTYGHDAGDAVLVVVGQRLVAALRGGDTVARFGGDEFLVLCEEVADRHEAAALAQRMAEEVGHPIEVGEHTVSVRASIGVVVVSDEATDPDDLVRAADDAMYRAKRERARHIEVIELTETPARAATTPRSDPRPTIEAGAHPL